MKSIIKILPDNLANKIAAGEVIQRPESVIKELLENSIDAGARNVEVIIKQAGKTLIQVCDDGSGMSEDDVLLCIKKHATSKIEKVDDLEAIKTLGFRGEALSSISAVSQLEIKTQTADEDLGTLLRIESDSEIIKEKVSTAKGTCISVKNIFYNIPARRKFLKSDPTELKHIVDTFNRIALAYPQVGFRFFNSDNLLFDYASTDLPGRVQQVFADNMVEALLHVDEHTDYISIKGFIGKPSIFRKSKGEQYLYLNNRFVINKNINHAVFSAFENILEKGDYPFFILFIELDSSKIDVNVHPSKLEVKFDDEKDIYNFVLSVIKKTLGTHDLVPSMSFVESEISGGEKIKVNPFISSHKDDFSDRPSFIEKKRERISDEEIELVFSSLTENIKREESSEPDKNFTEIEHKIFQVSTSAEEESTFIIQLHNKYILSQIKSGLMIIDQHVAHERILYEKALKRMEANLPFSQHLLFPLTIQFDIGSYEILNEINQYLLRLGFQLKFLAKNKVRIDGVPEDVKKGSEEKLLKDLIAEYQQNQVEKNLEEKDNIAKSFSCKAAIKAGDKLSEKEMRLLIDQLFSTSMPYVCPHGRPIIIKISLDEFDRRFGRT